MSVPGDFANLTAHFFLSAGGISTCLNICDIYPLCFILPQPEDRDIICEEQYSLNETFNLEKIF